MTRPGGVPPRRVPILTYHQVTERPDPTYRVCTVTPGELRAQVRWLSAAGYRSIGLEDLARADRGETVLPPRAVVITFDDGYRDALEHALPILAGRGFRAVFFVVAGMVGRTSEWRRHSFPLADWGRLRDALEAGCEIGSHTLTHRRLDALHPGEREEELRRSRAVLEAALGREVAQLSYPYGAFDPGVVELAGEAGYRLACTTRRGLAGAGPLYPLALPRVHVAGRERLSEFRLRVRTGWIPPRSWARARAVEAARMGRRIRRRILGSTTRS